MRNQPKWILAGLVVVLCCIGFHPGLKEHLSFEPAREGQVWRWMTCHWVHWNLSHLFWSASTFLAMLIFWPKRSMGAFVQCCVLSSLAIPLSVSVFAGALPNYGGLSGIDSALFVLFVLLWMKARRAEGETLSLGIGACLLLGFIGKAFYETLSGGALFAEMGSGMVSVPVAHLTGGFVGWMCTIEKKRNWWHHPMGGNPVIVRETK